MKIIQLGTNDNQDDLTKIVMSYKHINLFS